MGRRVVGVCVLVVLGIACDGADPELGTEVASIDACGTPPCLAPGEVAISTSTYYEGRLIAAASRPDGITLVAYLGRDEGLNQAARARFVDGSGIPLFAGDFTVCTLAYSVDIAVSPDGTFLVVCAGIDLVARVVRFEPSGPVLSGPEWVIPEDTRLTQGQPAVAADPDGTFIVVWRDPVGDPSFSGVRMRRVSAVSGPIGHDRRVNSTKTGAQKEPDIAFASNGSYVVTFSDASAIGDGETTAIRARAYTTNDLPRGPDYVVNEVAGSGTRSQPAIAVGSDDRYVVAWTDGTGVGDPNPTGIRARWLSDKGVPVDDDFAVNTTTARNQSEPAISYDVTGDSFVIAWTDASRVAPDTADNAVRIRQLQSDGTFAEPDQVVNITTTGRQIQPGLPPCASGSMLVTWTDSQTLSQDYQVRGRMFLTGCPVVARDFYADPNVVRPPGLVPTGASFPPACAFPTLTEALAAATASAASVPNTDMRVIATDASTPTGAVRFENETFPWSIPERVAVITTPELLGVFDPDRFEIVVDNGGASLASIRVLGAATREGIGGKLGGFTVREGLCGGGACPVAPVAIRVEGFGGVEEASQEKQRLARLQIRGGPAWETGVLVRGNGLIKDVFVTGFTSASGDRVGMHVQNDGGASALLDRASIFGGGAYDNDVGLLVTGGTVDMLPFGAISSVGDGVVFRDSRVTPGGTVITPITFQGYVQSDANGGNGLVVDLQSPASTVQVKYFAARDNGGHGIRILGAPHTDAALDGVTHVTEYGFDLVGGAYITGNAGAGISIGGGAQQHTIVARIGGFNSTFFGPNQIFANAGPGIDVAQAAPATTAVAIGGNLITSNAGAGVQLGSAVLVSPGTNGMGLGFISNEVAHNGMADAGCTGAQDVPQILVSGPVAMAPGACAAAGIDTFAECDAQNVPATSTNALNNHCAWTGTGCAVAWDLRGDTGAACETGWDSRIYDYNTGDGADPASVGLRATGGAIVNADNKQWRTSTLAENVSMDTSSFVQASAICGVIAECQN